CRGTGARCRGVADHGEPQRIRALELALPGQFGIRKALDHAIELTLLREDAGPVQHEEAAARAQRAGRDRVVHVASVSEPVSAITAGSAAFRGSRSAAAGRRHEDAVAPRVVELDRASVVTGLDAEVRETLAELA